MKGLPKALVLGILVTIIVVGSILAFRWYILARERRDEVVPSWASRMPSPPATPAAASPEPTQTPPSPSPAGETSEPQTQETAFKDLPGIDLAGLKPAQKDRFLKRVNTETCTCGCKGDTVARCLVEDPNCRIAPQQARAILAETKLGS
ncbi:MAG: hypothetical protein HY652_13235 [Acidobacteria bacterium]|nr:hypothetical protein [Acidobacteriota bacterium]